MSENDIALADEATQLRNGLNQELLDAKHKLWSAQSQKAKAKKMDEESQAEINQQTTIITKLETRLAATHK